MNEEEKYNLIENYANGILSKEEHVSFESMLKNDPEFSRKYKLYQLADELVIENRLLQVNTILLEEKNRRGGNTTLKIILGTFFLAACAILFYSWEKNNSETTDASFNQKSKPEITEVISSNENITISESGKIHYENKSKSSTPIPANPEEEKEDKFSEIIPVELKPENQEQETTKNTIPNATFEKNTTTVCSDIHIETKFFTTASCADEANGSISFTDFKGGTAPYSVSVKNKQNDDVSSLNIPSGQYTAIVSDKNGCTKLISSISIPEKVCDKEYSFNPFREEVLTLPAQNKYGTLSIYERSGNIYYTKTVEPSEEIQWNGYSERGELNAGYFIFEIAYKDGKEVRGGITIVQ